MAALTRRKNGMSYERIDMRQTFSVSGYVLETEGEGAKPERQHVSIPWMGF